MSSPSDCIEEVRDEWRDNGLYDELVDSLNFNGMGMLMVKHYLMDTPLMYDVKVPKGQKPIWKYETFNKELQKTDTYIDFLNKSFDLQTEWLKECIDKKEWDTVLLVVDNKHLIKWFMENHYDLEDEGFFHLLKRIWVLDEQWDSILSLYDAEEIRDLFTYRGNPHRIMNDEDLDGFNKLDDELTLYRGVAVRKGEEFKTNKEDMGLSFTTDKKKGIWFSWRRCPKEGIPYLIEITINKKDIFFYTDDRNEKECLINPLKIKTVKHTNMRMN